MAFQINKTLSDLTVYMKYAKTLSNGKRESWNELVDRNMNMHLKKYKQAHLVPTIHWAYNMVRDKKILPSMRSLQFGGRGIEENNVRLYNCCYLPIDSLTSFKEVLYMLLCGTGVGYSVQTHHIAKLPKVNVRSRELRYVVEDSIEGWANAFGVLLEGFLTLGQTFRPTFDFSLIRPKGSLIKSINRASPGPEMLKVCLEKVESFLLAKDGMSLSSVDVMDILNSMSECVMAGGIRRSAMICLFSSNDDQMINCKNGNWWQTHPWRSRSNNSAVIYNTGKEEQDFYRIWKALSTSKSGEPGFYFSNDDTGMWGTNPCVETALRPYQFCNLCEINAFNVENQEDLNQRAAAAAVLGTLQAGYTNFNYINSEWKTNTVKDSLLGIGLTGIASGRLENLSLKRAAKVAVTVNSSIASAINIPKAARITCVKPSGTSSLVLGSSSGIHAIHSKYYIRHIRISKDEPIYSFLKVNSPTLIEDEVGRETSTAVIKIPQNMDYEGANYRDEPTLSFLERIKRYNSEWVLSGHNSGVNTHNVSATISVKETDWKFVGNWLWENRRSYTGISCLPYDGGNYLQAPFEECSKQKYETLALAFTGLDLSEVGDSTSIRGLEDVESACAGGLCDVK